MGRQFGLIGHIDIFNGHGKIPKDDHIGGIADYVSSRGRFRAGACGCLLALAVWPAPAQASFVFTGTCLVSASMGFSPGITFISGPVSITDLSVTGTCVDDANLPLGVIHTIDVGGSGAGTVTTCGAISGFGTFGAGFTPAPAAPAADGTWTFTGSIAGGVLVLTGSSTTGGPFAAAAVLAGIPLGATSCGGGLGSASFLGSLTFTDP